MADGAKETYNIVTVGTSASGKSSLARCLAGIELPSENKVTGVERHRFDLTVDGKDVVIDVRECPSRLMGKDYLQMIQATCKEGQAFVIVYASGDGPPEQVVMQHLNDIVHSREPPEFAEEVPYVIIATKCDREAKDRTTLIYALQKLAKKLKRPFIDTSSLLEWNTYTLFEILIRLIRLKTKVSTPSPLSIFKKKTKFKDNDFSDWWEWAKPTIFPPNSATLPEVVRAVQLHQTHHLYELLKKSNAGKRPSAASPPSNASQSASMRTSASMLNANSPDVNVTLVDNLTPLHLACTWGYVDIIRVLIDFGANVYAKDAGGKTPLYRAAINGQLRALPLLLERVNPFDSQNIEAMKLAFRREVVALFDADELCIICRDIAKTGFDLQIVAKDLEALEQALTTAPSSSSKDSSQANDKNDEKAAHQVSKALAAIRIALETKDSPNSATGASLSRSAGLSSSAGSSSPLSSSSSSSSLLSSGSSSSSRPQLDAKNPVEGPSDEIPIGYLIELAESFRTTTDAYQRTEYANKIQTIGIGASPSLRYQLAKLVTGPGVDRLRTTVNTAEALAIVRMIYTLTIDSDKATALIGSEMNTIPALLHFMATTNQVVTQDLQTQAAIALASLAADKNKDIVSTSKGIAILQAHLGGSNDRLLVAVMKALGALAANEGIASEMIHDKTFVPKLVDMIKGTKKLSVKVQALKLISIVAQHESILSAVIGGGVSSALLATLFTGSVEYPKLYGNAVRVLASMSKHNEWVPKAGPTAIKALATTWPKMKNRDSRTGRQVIDILRKFAGVNAEYKQYLESVDVSAILEPGKAKPAAKSAHAETINKVMTSLQSTNFDQAVKAANQLAALVKAGGIDVKREMLERGAFAALWKLVQLGKLDWTGEWLPKVPVESLEIKEKIGRGAFGVVYSALMSLSGAQAGKKEWVAVKALEEEHLQFNDFKSELVTLSMLTGIVDNIVQFKGYCFIQQRSSGKLDQVKNFHCVVMELMETTLERVIFAKKKLMNYKKMKKVAYEIARGMAMLHSYDIIHRDLKPANILISKKAKVWEVKIADLGYARRDTLDSIRKSVVGTPAYLAPELMDQKKSLDVTKATDVYSFGVLLWEMVTRKRALEDVEAARLPFTVLTAKQQNKPLLTVGNDCDPVLKSLIESCLAYNPTKRPSFDEIKSILWQSSSTLA